MKTIRSVYDAGQERRDECESAMHRAQVNQNKINAERAQLALYPEIGVLTNCKGKTKFYAYVNGEYFEHQDIDVISRKVSPTPRLTCPTP